MSLRDYATEAEITGRRPCKWCDGTGWSGAARVECREHDRSWAINEIEDRILPCGCTDGFVAQAAVPCPNCKGTGKISIFIGVMDLVAFIQKGERQP